MNIYFNIACVNLVVSLLVKSKGLAIQRCYYPLLQQAKYNQNWWEGATSSYLAHFSNNCEFSFSYCEYLRFELI
jgi:hypothetical protein